MIDNYDSFTYNLVQFLEELGEELVVKRNDQIEIEEVEKLDPEIITISPGPSNPTKAGLSLEIVKEFKGKKPVLGICLGHQVIAHHFGAKIVKAKEPVHGKVHPIEHNNTGVFKGLNNPLQVTRYHSLVIDKATLPQELEVTAVTYEGEIMGIKHREYSIEGVQFHPEAILTEQGQQILENFIKKVRGDREND
nr:aminodeoxychorismate/anthranilate synthase component II [Halonatronum saccharophilum]